MTMWLMPCRHNRLAKLRTLSSSVALLLIFLSTQAFAYIPSTRTILNRMARNLGRGIYQIDQEVQFRLATETVAVRERWIVENGDIMRLTMSNPKGTSETWNLDVVYRDGKRWLVESPGEVKSVKQSPEFFEPYLHYRAGKTILESLIRQRVLPSNLTTMQKTAKSLNDVTYRTEGFVRLARAGGVIAYAFGEPTPVSNLKLAPGFWVDQDAFLFRRIRYPSQAEVEADKHIFASGGMRIPRERTVTWDNNTAVIRILSVKTISDSAQVRTLLSSSSLRTTQPLKLPDVPQVKDFYLRFR